MIPQLNAYLKEKKYFVFDFDRTITRLEIDWSDWHKGIAAVYEGYDPNHGYNAGKNPHLYHNALVAKYGDELLHQAGEFNRQYEAMHLAGFTPNNDLLDFIRSNSSVTHYVYSSNSRQTVLRGLEELDIWTESQRPSRKTMCDSQSLILKDFLYSKISREMKASSS